MHSQYWRMFPVRWELGFVAPICRVLADLRRHLTEHQISNFYMSLEGRKLQAKKSQACSFFGFAGNCQTSFLKQI